MDEIIIQEELGYDNVNIPIRKNIDREIENLGLDREVADRAKDIYNSIGISFHKKNRELIEIGCIAHADSSCDLSTIMYKNGISSKKAFKALSQTSYRTKENIFKINDNPLNYFDSIYSLLEINLNPILINEIKNSLTKLDNYLKFSDDSPRNIMIAIFKIYFELYGIKLEKKLYSLIQTEKNKFNKIYNDIKVILIN